MPKRTITIERFHVHGTANHCLALYYRGKELTPRDGNAHGHATLPAWIPDDVAGLARVQASAKKQGFTHARYTGWPASMVPKNGSL